MNKKQIKAELRRSACNSRYPMGDLILNCYEARIELNNWLGRQEMIYKISDESRRTFMLLVAEAIE